MLEYWTANIQSLTKIKLVDVISPATLKDASDGAGAPEEVPGQVEEVEVEVEVAQVRPSSRDRFGFSSEGKSRFGWVGFFSMKNGLAFARPAAEVPRFQLDPGLVARGAQNPLLEGKTLISRRSGKAGTAA